jgi:hypothetical protein
MHYQVTITHKDADGLHEEHYPVRNSVLDALSDAAEAAMACPKHGTVALYERTPNGEEAVIYSVVKTWAGPRIDGRLLSRLRYVRLVVGD